MTMQNTIPQPAATTDEPACPAWCTRRHAAPLLPGEDPRWRDHLTAECPAWCMGHPYRSGELDTHRGADTFMDLSLVPHVEWDGAPEGPDQLAVSVWDIPHEGTVTVSVRRTGDDSELPPLTPDEAVALGVALIAKARDARQGTLAASGVRLPAQGCPPWCTSGPHGELDDVHMSSSYAVSVTERELCSYEQARKAGRTSARCGEDMCAELVNGDDGCPVVEVYHGDDSLPHMTLDAAEEFAAGILALTATARAAARPEPDGAR
jgi:uncharacterized protein DUF6907